MLIMCIIREHARPRASCSSARICPVTCSDRKIGHESCGRREGADFQHIMKFTHAESIRWMLNGADRSTELRSIAGNFSMTLPTTRVIRLHCIFLLHLTTLKHSYSPRDKLVKANVIKVLRCT